MGGGSMFSLEGWLLVFINDIDYCCNMKVNNNYYISISVSGITEILYDDVNIIMMLFVDTVNNFWWNLNKTMKEIMMCIVKANMWINFCNSCKHNGEIEWISCLVVKMS